MRRPEQRERKPAARACASDPATAHGNAEPDAAASTARKTTREARRAVLVRERLAGVRVRVRDEHSPRSDARARPGASPLSPSLEPRDRGAGREHRGCKVRRSPPTSARRAARARAPVAGSRAREHVAHGLGHPRFSVPARRVRRPGRYLRARWMAERVERAKSARGSGILARSPCSVLCAPGVACDDAFIPLRATS